MFYGGHVRTVGDIKHLKERGLDFGEVVLKDSQARDYWSRNRKELTADKGFFFIAHGPHEGDPNSLDNLHNNYIPALKETVLTVSRMGIGFLTTHLWMDSRYVLPDVIAVKIEALEDLRCFGEERHVEVSLENLSESNSDFSRIVSAIPELSLTLDVGHGQLLTRLNRSFEIIRDFHKRVRHVHVHDNLGGVGVQDDLHLPMGQGIVDFEGIFYELIKNGYDGTITLELKPEELEQSLVCAKSLVNRITERLQLGR